MVPAVSRHRSADPVLQSAAAAVAVAVTLVVLAGKFGFLGVGCRKEVMAVHERGGEAHQCDAGGGDGGGGDGGRRRWLGLERRRVVLHMMKAPRTGGEGGRRWLQLHLWLRGGPSCL